MSRDPELAAHKEWLGLVQPVGLVVSPHALVAAQAAPSRNVVEQQQLLCSLCADPATEGNDKLPKGPPRIRDLAALCQQLLGWSEDDLLGRPGAPVPESLFVGLPDYGETLKPSYAVPDPDRESRLGSAVDGRESRLGSAVDDRAGAYLMLITVHLPGTDLDARPTDAAVSWHASPQAKFERLLREREVPVGLLCNGDVLRLVYAPRGETSGHLSFPVAAMTQVAGRPILAALLMLLGSERVLGYPAERRLGVILAESRKYQSEVLTLLAEQVLGALLELLRGVQSADAQAGGRILSGVRSEDIYGGLLTTILRLVFLLYAEERSLLPGDPVYSLGYSVTALFERLREDAAQNPDTMDQRYGAWAHLCSLVRLVYDGASHGACHLPARHGELFDPDRYPFLEGRAVGEHREVGGRLQHEVPRVSDGVVEKVLGGLLMLKGERLSYRALDVEQIGSVYEAMMGYAVERAAGPSLAVRPHHVVVNLAALLQQRPAERAKWLKEEGAGCEVGAKDAEALKGAQTIDALAAALGKKVSPRTPHVLPAGALFLQPGEERRRSGSHYTPRALTEPIVRTTLRPVLEALGARPLPGQLLDLKVCDPAMGSGAFLVEACRQLAEALVAAWDQHRQTPEIPPDEEPVLHARRLVAQCCLYGVDKNPFAVSLAKLSLWLVTLARDQPFTFLDHALRHGDSLVGLTCGQIAAFRWDGVQHSGPLFAQLGQQVAAAQAGRQAIHALGDGDDSGKRLAWREADDALHAVRLMGDLVVAAYFSAEKDKAREERRRELQNLLRRARAGVGEEAVLESVVAELRAGARGVAPFHWEIEFPEVFGRVLNTGFDAVVGNPPFAGKNNIINGNAPGYVEWLKLIHPGAHGSADLVAHFFWLTFVVLRSGGTFGLIATNTIAQGDTRSTGLRWICRYGGVLYEVKRRLRWPGAAAVVVSVVHGRKGVAVAPILLDGAPVPRITAFLFHGGGNEDPAVLKANQEKGFIGSYVLGMGFTFDDGNPEATSLTEMRRLIEKDSRNQELIFPYLGGEELNSSPNLQRAYRRYIINFGEMGEEEARSWPDLIEIVETKVKGTRGKHSTAPWWQFERVRGELKQASQDLDRVLVIARVGQHGVFGFIPSKWVYSEQLVVFSNSTNTFFAVLQSRTHEIWARFFGSSMKDDLRYTPSDCFETFPFPPDWEQNPALEAAGQQYYDYRAALMIQNNAGLTATYNRFHDPDERDPGILQLRALHAAMDRAVLDAYGWSDIATACEFRLDYEEEDDANAAALTRRKKKPYRLRWPAAVHDEVLARLLDLNQRRAEEERLAGPPAGKAPRRPPARRAPKPKVPAKDAAPATPPKPKGQQTLL